MSELRHNAISGEWVVIATERARRPEDFAKVNKERSVNPEYSPACPFCPGNEALSPEEAFRIGDEGKWTVRVIPNKFPALSPKETLARKDDGLLHLITGYGIHEVIIENPRHNAFIPLMTNEEVKNIILAYKNRYMSLRDNEDIKAVIVFKNHGPMAGTSLEHPHSQVVAVPIIPPQIENRMTRAAHYSNETGRCIFCQMMTDELMKKERIVLETDKFVVFEPYASMVPFHTWIFPRVHASSFSEINEGEIDDLALCLKRVLSKIYYGLGDPDLNYVINSAPFEEKRLKGLHWYLSIMPRITKAAGFEVGSGIFINTSLPEKAAEFLRQVKV